MPNHPSWPAELVEKAATRPFPMQDGPSIPWCVAAAIYEHLYRYRKQTLERLAERGGFGWGEVAYMWSAKSGTTDDHRQAAQAAVLSALSGDLVPREEVVRRLNDALGGDGGLDADDLEGMVDVVRAIETARKYEAERYDTARSQADALAEALEEAREHLNDFRAPIPTSVKRALASYRSSSSTEKEG